MHKTVKCAVAMVIVVSCLLHQVHHPLVNVTVTIDGVETLAT